MKVHNCAATNSRILLGYRKLR